MAVSAHIRLIIVDDHAVLRRGVVAGLAHCGDIEMVAEAGSGEEALVLVHHLFPDVVLVDLTMPGMGGVATIQALTVALPATRLIAFSDLQEGRLQEEAAVQAGAVASLSKDVPPDVLAGVVRTAHYGELELVRALNQPSVRELTPPSPPPQDHRVDDLHLSPRQHEVLTLLTEGITYDQIAERLSITAYTFKSHVKNLRFKLGTTNRTATVILAWHPQRDPAKRRRWLDRE